METKKKHIFYLKNGFRYEGEIIKKTKETYIIKDIKENSKIEIFNSAIAAVMEKNE